MNAPIPEPTGFVSHLIELRNRLLRATLVVLLLFLALCVYPGPTAMYDILAAPMLNALPTGGKMIAYGVVTPFLVPIKVTLLAGFLLGLPYVLYQAWAFIAPGLYQHEKRLLLPVVVSSYLLFLVGMAFCYFFVFQTVFAFMAGVSPESINFAPDIEAYLGFTTTLFLAFGLTFEVPVVVLVLAGTGTVALATFTRIRPYVIVGAFVAAAILTPPDVISQFMMAVPLILLYEFGLLAARVVLPRR